MYRKAYFFYLLFFVVIISCKRKQAVQEPGTEFLQGEWQQDSVRMQSKLLSYSLYRFKFRCDSVYITTNNFSKVNYGVDSCMNKGNWKEYVRGKYELHHDTLRVRGLYCHPDFSLKYEGCFNIGVYENLFKLQKQTGSLFHVTSFSSTIPFNMRLIKKTICQPKPL